LEHLVLKCKAFGVLFLTMNGVLHVVCSAIFLPILDSHFGHMAKEPA